MAKFHIDSIQNWEPFEHDGETYSLSHLDAHEITYKGQKQGYKFIVTYGLHCFAKDGTFHNIPLMYEDGREQLTICMERYEADPPQISLQMAFPSANSFFLVVIYPSFRFREHWPGRSLLT
ncbi:MULTISPECIES: hypothetical protein [Citrobacter freundii complex]|uniref:hypothetical protein n=1 Tax=Citrobacter freundii complex TaxID=1344959 RepID=UPI00174BFA27|nr:MULTISPECIES: hypothetical protein [Citrobacter freundii complex]HCT6408999.1 hypothetical protein [Citrobacter freundii]HCT6425853.1 hypothetical protein [Citrobacter freundii]